MKTKTKNNIRLLKIVYKCPSKAYKYYSDFLEINKEKQDDRECPKCQ
jgi:hypothetical protein